MQIKSLLYLLLILLTAACSTTQSFVANEQPTAPDYSVEQNWSALPFRLDAPDEIPPSEKWISDSLKKIDVFYVYPTIYHKGDTWNADINNTKLNKKIDKLPVRLQASAFNQSGRVYAPRYRQASYKSYTDTTGAGVKALAFAYEDVKRAFDYYLENYNQGRPIIIASHSQGSNHTLQLLTDYFDNEKMKTQLVCAYMVGMATDSNQYKILKPCLSPRETNCYITWSSYKEGYAIDSVKDASEILVGNVCVNPVSWTVDNLPAVSKGGILLKISREKTFTTTATIHDNYLWVKTNTILFKRKKELHLLDYNMFWYNIRRNADERIKQYFKKE